MNRPRVSLCLLGLAALFATPLPAQAPAQTPAPDTAPPILLPASANTLTATLTLQAPKAPVKDDLKAGLLASTDHPSLQIIPDLDLGVPTQSGTAWIAPITLTGLIPFGDSTIPIFFQGKKIETLHVLKSGLALDTPPTVQQENDPLLLVLQNPSGFSYTSVRARLRFQGQDVCTFAVERFAGPSLKPASTRNWWQRLFFPGDSTNPPPSTCDAVDSWTEFRIPQYAGVSLRAVTIPSWFIDDSTGLGRTGPQKGTLTLRFSSDAIPPSASASQPAKQPAQSLIHEQTLPLTIEFHHTGNIYLVAFWLAVGALFSVAVRVAIPNFRRYRAIKDQLVDVKKTTRGISEEVDSMLRVQLRVERLGLDTLRKTARVWDPSFVGVAQRVEAATATLQRRIDYARRLDATLNRRRLLIADGLAPPSRVDAINRHLDAACESLKSDQFREQDWVFIQQELEAADKTLGNPSEEEKGAFETTLIQRWISISEHFGFQLPTTTPKADSQWLKIQDRINDFRDHCFASPNTLPREDDKDGSKWIKSIGIVRADLQITALELLREFEFLAPPPPAPNAPAPDLNKKDRWADAKAQLIAWLATPALENLDQARRLLRQLSEGIDPADIQVALQSRNAHIELDPQNIGPGERIHLAIRFRRPDWNSAASRLQVVCEWHFQPTAAKNPDSPVPPYCERGWDIYHYFEDTNSKCDVKVLFFLDGKPICEAGSENPLTYTDTIDLNTPEAVLKKKSDSKESRKRLAFEAIELGTALLIPLCALAVSSSGKGGSGLWWQLVALGFGSDTIRNVLSAKNDPAPGPSTQP